jgi:hypothetical protein
MLAVLGGLADVERDLIRTRTAEGRSRAKAQGQQMGRPPKLTPQQQKEARRRRAKGATLKELAQAYSLGDARSSSARRGQPSPRLRKEPGGPKLCYQGNQTDDGASLSPEFVGRTFPKGDNSEGSIHEIDFNLLSAFPRNSECSARSGRYIFF